MTTIGLPERAVPPPVLTQARHDKPELSLIDWLAFSGWFTQGEGCNRDANGLLLDRGAFLLTRSLAHFGHNSAAGACLGLPTGFGRLLDRHRFDRLIARNSGGDDRRQGSDETRKFYWPPRREGFGTSEVADQQIIGPFPDKQAIEIRAAAGHG